MPKSNAERQSAWRAKRQAELDRLREEAATAPDVEQLRRELAQQRAITASTLAELCQVSDERDALKLENARLRRAAPEPEPKPKRRQR